MDIIKFNNDPGSTRLKEAEIVDGFTSKLWIERYERSGEFKLVSESDISFRETLPIGSFVSHVDTSEVMIVENHEIHDDRGKEPTLEITGRSIESFFEHRVVGSNKSFPTNSGEAEYILPPDTVANQVVRLIRQHIEPSLLINDGDSFPFIDVMSEAWIPSEVIERSIRREVLYSSVINLLSVADLGLKNHRPGPLSPLGSGATSTALIVHHGVDRTKDVVLSYDTGEIEGANYLWSNKGIKNAALVSGRWVETVVLPPEHNYERRMMHVDATDIDNYLNAPPTGALLTFIVNRMQDRGKQALASQKNVAITTAEATENIEKFMYRKDFNIGDLVLVRGDYHETAKMRVSEFVEIDESTGEKGYPTLTVP